MRFAVTLTLAALLAPVAHADTLQCQAQVALNRVYDVTVDLDSGETVVVNDAGTRYSGRAVKAFDGIQHDTTYFLSSGYGVGVLVDVAPGASDVAMCLADNECYRCRQ